MGLSHRKSFKAGPVRVTASKSGVSYSVGGKRARVTRRANGRVQATLSAPGSRPRYATASQKRKTATAARPARQPAPKPTYTKADWIGAGIFFVVIMTLGLIFF